MVVSELFQATKRLQTDLTWLTEAKFFEKTDSTQKRIAQFLPKTGEGAVLVLAEEQTKGVGRENRPWSSPVGGIWFTLALPMTGKDLGRMVSFSVLSAYLIVNSLKEIYNLKAEVKWPNDVMHEGKKLAGTLCTTTKKFKKDWFLIGVGINVNNALPGDLAATATTLKEIRGQAQGRTRLIESVLDAFWNAWSEYDRTGFGPFHASVEAVLSGKGKAIEIKAGETVYFGEVVGIDPEGALVIKSPNGTQSIRAGEIVGQPA